MGMPRGKMDGMGQRRTTARLDEAAQRGRTSIRERAQRLWALTPALGQTGLAAGVAWAIANGIVGHARPFMAPVAAIIALGITYGERTRRAVEIVVGVAVGVLAADLLARWLGVGPLQIALVSLLAMSAAVVLGGQSLVVTQAAVSAIFITTVTVAHNAPFDRFFDALIGGAVALVVNLVLFPLEPVRLAQRAARPLLEELAAVLDDVAGALVARDHDTAMDALVRARGLDGRMAQFINAADVGGEVALFSPVRRGRRPALARYREAATHIDLAVRNVRVLARGAVRAVDLDAHIPDDTIEALCELAGAVRTLAPALDDPARTAEAREQTLTAAGRATLSLERTGNLSASVLVGQVRSMAVDLLQGLGVAGGEAQIAVRHAAARVERDAIAEQP
jgi:uncharacterized membrane protein YgaE (UPF0421/DUF939 family)